MFLNDIDVAEFNENAPTEAQKRKLPIIKGLKRSIVGGALGGAAIGGISEAKKDLDDIKKGVSKLDPKKIKKLAKIYGGVGLVGAGIAGSGMLAYRKAAIKRRNQDIMKKNKKSYN